MKVKHVVCTALVVFAVLLVLHYFTHHKGQSVVGSYIPGA